VLLAAFVLYRIALRMAGPSDASCGCLGEAKSRLAAHPDAELVRLVPNLTVAVVVAIYAATGSDRYSPTVSAVLAGLTAAGLLALALRQRSNLRSVERRASVPSVQRV